MILPSGRQRSRCDRLPMILNRSSTDRLRKGIGRMSLRWLLFGRPRYPQLAGRLNSPLSNQSAEIRVQKSRAS
ncbi:hypothetical protein CKO51_08330 [Rhodopirellula sp. SM50]|nr:hypothetical protein CKO51_08330 [Rhodopirellula sp. SM50]